MFYINSVVDWARVKTLQPAQTTAGGEKMEVGSKSDTEARR